MGLFDVHAHLTHPRLSAELPAVLLRARAAGVTTIVANGLNPRDNEAVLALAAREPMVRPALGLYPVDAVLADMLAAGHTYPRDEEGPIPTTEEAVRWVEQHVEQAFAIGEVGLDGYWVPEAFWPAQEQALRRLVRLALDADKPLVVHTRKRERRTLELLTELGATRVDWHCFGGKVSLARSIAEGGHYLSIPANVRRSESFTRIVDTCPRDRILLETDCPYLAPERDASSEPCNVRGTVAFVAERWKVTEREVEARLSDNFARLFGVAP